MDWLVKLISAIRAVRAEMNVPPSARMPLLIKGAAEETKGRLATHREAILTLARAASITVVADVPGKGVVQVVVDEATILLPLADVIDLEQEKARLAKDVAKLSGDIEKVERKLGNRTSSPRRRPKWSKSSVSAWVIGLPPDRS